jgi:hypothetical protein
LPLEPVKHDGALPSGTNRSTGGTAMAPTMNRIAGNT